MKEKILNLWAEGKNYDEIKKILGCSKGTISYHCGIGQKEKTQHRQAINRAIKKEFKKSSIQLSHTINIKTIKNKRKYNKNGISGKKQFTKYGWTNEEHELGLNLVKEGKSFVEIAKILNKKYRGVKSHYHNLGIKNGIRKIKYIECIECKKITRKNPIINGKRTNRVKFCSQKCNGLYYGSKKIKERCKCKNCNKEIEFNEKRYKKYCNRKCSMEFAEKIKIAIVMSSDIIPFSQAIIKKYLIKIYGEKCMKCGWNERHTITNKVPIEMNHKDGNSRNHRLDNLELLCPNHHSLTLNYRALNKGNGRHKRMQRWKDGKSF